jgi:hypothetical protein
MAIILKKTADFADLPDILQKVAKKYLLGKEYKSLADVTTAISCLPKYPDVDMIPNYRCHSEFYYSTSEFYIQESRVKVKKLPYAISEVIIAVKWQEPGTMQFTACAPLVAKLSK